MSKWINHVKATRAANPGMSYKDAMSAASLTWTKGQTGGFLKKKKKKNQPFRTKSGIEVTYDLQPELDQKALALEASIPYVPSEKKLGNALWLRGGLKNRYCRSRPDGVIVCDRVAKGYGEYEKDDTDVFGVLNLGPSEMGFFDYKQRMCNRDGQGVVCANKVKTLKDIDPHGRWKYSLSESGRGFKMMDLKDLNGNECGMDRHYDNTPYGTFRCSNNPLDTGFRYENSGPVKHLDLNPKPPAK